MVKKLLNLRLWPDKTNPTKAWSSNVMDLDYEVLLVSQFTMYGELKGYKPDFHLAMPPTQAKTFYDDFVQLVKKSYKDEKVQSGIFAADMLVGIENDGPITLVVESPQDPPERKRIATHGEPVNKKGAKAGVEAKAEGVTPTPDDTTEASASPTTSASPDGSPNRSAVESASSSLPLSSPTPSSYAVTRSTRRDSDPQCDGKRNPSHDNSNTPAETFNSTER